MRDHDPIERRSFIRTVGATVAAATLPPVLRADFRASEDESAAKKPFRLRYILSSAMYGKMPLTTILPEVAKTGARHIDIWCLVHGNQREQIEEMGHDAFRALLEKHEVELGVLTRYPLGPFRLQDEMKVLRSFGGKIIVTGSSGPRGPKGKEAKAAVSSFLEKLKPHVARAEELGVIIAIENHSGQLLYHPDSLRYFVELNRSKHLGIAFAPHHLHRFADEIPKLVRDVGAQSPFFYAQEHHEGMRKKVPKEEEMKQLPGYGGGLDYRPIVRAMREIDYQGFVEIFMHPVPRGIPILPTATKITAAINRSREYLERCLKETA